ncbi:MAG: S8 family serine peptidase [Caldilineaceae bacterium]|nr:S8 family serine peptidase [Caldilineaceae bacterium]
MGTITGGEIDASGRIIGMAPDAKWIGCRNMLNGIGTPASYTACFEFMLAPYPQQGDPFLDGQPELGPHVINNSWGCPPFEGCDAESLRQVVETVRAAGKFVVASAGNYGSSCKTVRDPIAIYDASFSVGAHDALGGIAGFSSRGPVTEDGSGRRKPDLTAPGVGVLSALPGGIISGISSGTSMAAPHVAGAVALLWSARADLIGEVDLTEQVLLKSATPVPNNTCDASAEAVTPNNTYGYGRLNILAAVELAHDASTATVTLRDCDGAVLPNALARFGDEFTGYEYAQLTNIAGVAHFPAIFTTALTESYALNAIAGSAQFTATDATLHRGAKGVFELQAAVCNQASSASVRAVDRFGNPVAHALVALHDTRTQHVYQATTDPTGTASFDPIYAGEYLVKTSAAELQFSDQSQVVVGGESVQMIVEGRPTVWRTFAPFVAR